MVITIRRFGGRAFTIDELTASGSLPAAVVEEAAAVLGAERNVLISGGTGSGKTTLLNSLVSLLPAEGAPHLDRVHAGAAAAAVERPALRGARAPRARRDDPRPGAARAAPSAGPDRRRRGARRRPISCRHSTPGHRGSLATVHANNATAGLSRLVTCHEASDVLPWAAVCRGVAASCRPASGGVRRPRAWTRTARRKACASRPCPRSPNLTTRPWRPSRYRCRPAAG